ncbi:MAG: hypothetical protein ACKVOA_07395 [Methylophilaceae bacterium]
MQKIILVYQGEVHGEALFARLASQSISIRDREKWQLLTQVEQTMQFELRDWLISIGKPVTPDLEIQREAEQEANEICQKTWAEAMQWLQDLSQPYVKEYEELSQHKSFVTEVRLHLILQRLAIHEKALFLFASGELSGDSNEAEKIMKSLLSG